MKNSFDATVSSDSIIEQLRPSPLYAFGSVSGMFVMAIVIAMAAAKFFPILIIISLILALLLTYRYLYINSIRYTLTNQSLVVRTGLIARRYDNLELFRVQDYVITQSLGERMFNLMTVTLTTSDVTHPKLKLSGIDKSNIVERIRDLVQSERLKNNIFEVN